MLSASEDPPATAAARGQWQGRIFLTFPAGTISKHEHILTLKRLQEAQPTHVGATADAALVVGRSPARKNSCRCKTSEANTTCLRSDVDPAESLEVGYPKRGESLIIVYMEPIDADVQVCPCKSPRAGVTSHAGQGQSCYICERIPHWSTAERWREHGRTKQKTDRGCCEYPEVCEHAKVIAASLYISHFMVICVLNTSGQPC